MNDKKKKIPGKFAKIIGVGHVGGKSLFLAAQNFFFHFFKFDAYNLSCF